MENNESFRGIDDTVTLEAIMEIFSYKNCSGLYGKPKLILLNGWKGNNLFYKKNYKGRIMFSSEYSDFLCICSSSDNVSSLLSPLPPSLFPSTLYEEILKHRSKSVSTLVGHISGIMRKKSRAEITFRGKIISICESCVADSTLQLQLSFIFREK